MDRSEGSLYLSLFHQIPIQGSQRLRSQFPTYERPINLISVNKTRVQAVHGLCTHGARFSPPWNQPAWRALTLRGGAFTFRGFLSGRFPQMLADGYALFPQAQRQMARRGRASHVYVELRADVFYLHLCG